MTRYGITTPPACALVSPDGRYKLFSGYIPKDRFIELVKSAKAELKEPPRPSRTWQDRAVKDCLLWIDDGSTPPAARR